MTEEIKKRLNKKIYETYEANEDVAEQGEDPEESDGGWVTSNGYRMKYGSDWTIRNIGLHLTEKMKEAISAARGDYEIFNGEPPLIAYPGLSLNPDNKLDNYEEENIERSKFFTNGNAALTDYGDPLNRPSVNYSLPGLAMGESRVINPDFQFNELDDVRSDWKRPYIGRLYSERIYDYDLPKVIFQPGLLKMNIGLFAAIGAFTSNITDGTASMANYLRDPKPNPIKFGFMKIGAAIRGVINFMTGGILSSKRFYKFEPAPRQYMRFVNEMLIEIASWMNLAGVPAADVSDNYSQENDGKIIENAENAEELLKKYSQDNGKTDEIFQFPQSKGYAGKSPYLSVLNIIPGWKVNRRDAMDQKADFKENWSDFVEETVNMTAATFIPYGLNRGVSISEDFGNSTQEHPLAADLNAKGQQAHQQSLTGVLETLSGDKTMKIAGDLLNGNWKNAAIDTALQGLSWLGKLAGKNGVAGEAGLIISGEGRFQLPEVWTDSSYNRSYTIPLSFFSPYGHRLSIFENTIVPLVLLLGMTMPRQVGTSTYMSPFYIKAFAKGLFSSEVGIIESLSIARGEEHTDITADGFTKLIEVTVRIKDVVPKIMLGLDAGVFGILSAKNVGFREFIALIANVDMIDRIALLNKFNVFKDALLNTLNGEALMDDIKFTLSQTLPFQILYKIRTNFFNYRPPQTVSSVGQSPHF
jgi:hypothetical protein